MDFFVDLLNNIYSMIVGILAAAGIDTKDFPEKIIPGGSEEE